MSAIFVCGSFAADGVGAHFCRTACGRRRSLLGRAWLLAGQKPGLGATRRERQHGGPVEGLQERGSDARASAVPRAGSGTWGPWSVAGGACSARSRRSRIHPVMGAVSARFQGVRAAKPNRAREIFWKFSERVRPPSKVPSARASETGAGGASPKARRGEHELRSARPYELRASERRLRPVTAPGVSRPQQSHPFTRTEMEADIA